MNKTFKNFGGSTFKIKIQDQGHKKKRKKHDKYSVCLKEAL